MGIAYQVNPKTVVRLGYGRSFDIGTFGSIFGPTVTQNLPVLAQQTVNPPNGNNYDKAFTLSSGPPALDPTTLLQNNCQNANGTGPNLITNPTGTKTECLGANGRPLYPDGVSPHVHPPTQRMLTVDAWNVTVQHAFSNSMSGEVAYVGNNGTHVFVGDGPNYNINQATIVGFCPNPPTCSQGLSGNAREPYYNLYGWSEGVQWYGNDSSNNYQSLQAKFDKRFGSGYQISANYTWAHANQYQDSYYIYNPSLVYGPSDFQRHHVFVLTNVISLPFGKGHKYLSNMGRGGDLVFGGWQINGAWTAMSGSPFTPGYARAGQDRDTGPGFPSIPGTVAAGTRSGNPTTTGYWYQPATSTLGGNVPLGSCPSDPTCKSGPWVRPGVGTFGNAGFDSLWGPRFFNADISLFKTLNITERFKAQIRTESYNFFNHVNLGGPDSCVDFGNGGKIYDILGSSNMREWQFSARIEF